MIKKKNGNFKILRSTCNHMNEMIQFGHGRLSWVDHVTFLHWET
jgi:hypothetical protein